MATLDDGLHRAIGTFMSDVDRNSKVCALADVLECATDAVARFLHRRRTLDEVLEFIRIHDPNRPTLPLHVLAHIRHLRYNPLLAEGTILPVECGARREPWIHALPDELRYVLLRLPSTAFPYVTPSGGVLMSADRQREIEDAYSNESPDSVWGRNAAKLIAERYIGMGHSRMLAFLVPPRVFFTFVEGGANGWDRHSRFTEAAALTEPTVEHIAWRSYFESD